MSLPYYLLARCYHTCLRGNNCACISTPIFWQTGHYRWRQEYGGLRMEQARKLKNLEKENARLKKLVADLALDNAILKEVAKGNF